MGMRSRISNELVLTLLLAVDTEVLIVQSGYRCQKVMADFGHFMIHAFKLEVP